MKTKVTIGAVCAAAVLVCVTAVSPVATAATPVDTSDLRDAVTVEGVRGHQAAFQAAADANGGVRTSGSPGYDASGDYVVESLEDAGYDVTVQPFEFPYFEELTPAELEQLAPNATVYEYGGFPSGFLTMSYSGSGVVTAAPQGVDIIDATGLPANTSTSGCEADDFGSFVGGSIAIIQRGSCSFAQKALNAEAAGAVGVVIFNEGQADLGRDVNFGGTLGGPGLTIPVVGASTDVGLELAEATSARIVVDAVSEIRNTFNVIADTPGGRDDRVVVVGAHLDSVSEGPGIQDNGSGSAAILEIALQMAELDIDPTNKVRFAWWGAEESGLLGSQFYVDNLSKREIKDIAANLNFDMIGSPNFVRFVYDGDGSDTAVTGPNGSGVIEDVFNDYFAEQGLPVEPTEFSGRSDYGPFIAVGVPAGGLFTGAEGIKTPEQVEIYGGTAGDQYDPCYHLACDTFDNISLEALDQMSDAAAHATLTFAMTTSAVNGTDKGNAKSTKTVEELEFKGNAAQQ